MTKRRPHRPLSASQASAKAPPTPRKQADVEKNLAEPDRRAQIPVDRLGRHWRRARRADGKQHRTADRMAVGGNHPPTQHMRAGFQLLRIVDGDGLVAEAKGGQRNRCAVGPHKGEHQRRHRLAEGQRKLPRALRQHRAVSRIGFDQRRMRERAARQADSHEQREDGQKSNDKPAGALVGYAHRPAEECRAHVTAMKTAARSFERAARTDHFFGNSLRPGAGFSSASSSCPAAGISIQRSAAPSHSCTTGKYSVSPAGRSAASVPRKTNSS